VVNHITVIPAKAGIQGLFTFSRSPAKQQRTDSAATRRTNRPSFRWNGVRCLTAWQPGSRPSPGWRCLCRD